MTQPLEITATLLALGYVLLAIRESRLCFLAGGLSALAYIGVFWQVNLYLEAGLQLFYIGMSIYGWFHWRKQPEATLCISSWSIRNHLAAAAAIGVLTALLGTLLRYYTNAALPYADSFTTIGALLTTWMVTEKVLENWLYWIVIDLVAAAMYIERGLMLTAVLFGLYTLLAFAGYLTWRQDFARDREA